MSQQEQKVAQPVRITATFELHGVDTEKVASIFSTQLLDGLIKHFAPLLQKIVIPGNQSPALDQPGYHSERTSNIAILGPEANHKAEQTQTDYQESNAPVSLSSFNEDYEQDIEEELVDETMEETQSAVSAPTGPVAGEPDLSNVYLAAATAADLLVIDEADFHNIILKYRKSDGSPLLKGFVPEGAKRPGYNLYDLMALKANLPDYFSQIILDRREKAGRPIVANKIPLPAVFLTISWAAYYMNLGSPMTLYLWERAGKIKGVDFGGTKHFQLLRLMQIKDEREGTNESKKTITSIDRAIDVPVTINEIQPLPATEDPKKWDTVADLELVLTMPAKKIIELGNKKKISVYKYNHQLVYSFDELLAYKEKTDDINARRADTRRNGTSVASREALHTAHERPVRVITEQTTLKAHVGKDGVFNKKQSKSLHKGKVTLSKSKRRELGMEV